jgi:hypothetical protein
MVAFEILIILGALICAATKKVRLRNGGEEGVEGLTLPMTDKELALPMHVVGLP